MKMLIKIILFTAIFILMNTICIILKLIWEFKIPTLQFLKDINEVVSFEKGGAVHYKTMIHSALKKPLKK